MAKSIIKGKFKIIGINTIDIELVKKMWNHNFWISKWNDEYRLIKQKAINTQSTSMKLTISGQQAKQLIKDLELTEYPSVFKSGSSFRKESDHKKIREYWLKKKRE